MTDLYQFGSPTLSQSRVEPYTATNYNQLGVSTTTSAYPATNYQSQAQTFPGLEVQSTAGIEGGDFGQLQAQGYGTADFAQEAVIQQAPQVTYQTIPEVNYVEQPQQIEYLQTVQAEPVVSVVPEVTTQYQIFTKYKPVTKTIYVPKVVTTYAPANSALPGSVMPGSVLTGSVNPSVVPQPVMPVSPVVSNQHFVNNYPVV